MVTGGDSGISLTFASRLLELGCNVVVADIAFEHGSSSDRRTHNEVYPPKLTFVRTDVTDWVQLNTAFLVAVETYGSVDIVCPAAGMSLPVRISFKIYNCLLHFRLESCPNYDIVSPLPQVGTSITPSTLLLRRTGPSSSTYTTLSDVHSLPSTISHTLIQSIHAAW